MYWIHELSTDLSASIYSSFAFTRFKNSDANSAIFSAFKLFIISQLNFTFTQSKHLILTTQFSSGGNLLKQLAPYPSKLALHFLCISLYIPFLYLWLNQLKGTLKILAMKDVTTSGTVFCLLFVFSICIFQDSLDFVYILTHKF